jgi:hypothetical protein
MPVKHLVSKPYEVEAVQVERDEYGRLMFGVMPDWLGKAIRDGYVVATMVRNAYMHYSVVNKGEVAEHMANEGDWIIRDPSGRLTTASDAYLDEHFTVKK